MKLHLISSGIILSLFLGSCATGPSDADIKAEQDSILQFKEDSLIALFMVEMSEIDAKLNEVNTRNGVFDLSSEKPEDLNKETILKRVESLDKLLESNQEQLNSLLSKIKRNDVKNSELTNMLDGMRLRITQKEEQIDDLMGLLTEKDLEIDQILLRIDSMRIDNIELTEEVIKLDEELHIVYYLVGEKNDLIEQKIITKEGGLLGIGATKQLNAADLDKSKFTEVDERDLINVPIFSKKARIITNHPKDSYRISLDENEYPESLDIIDRKAFWSVSDFLVVEVRN